jgi:hypothetical protein
MFSTARIPPGAECRGRTLALLLRIWKNLGSSTGLNTRYSERGFSRVSSVKCRDTASTQATTSSLFFPVQWPSHYSMLQLWYQKWAPLNKPRINKKVNSPGHGCVKPSPRKFLNEWLSENSKSSLKPIPSYLNPVHTLESQSLRPVSILSSHLHLGLSRNVFLPYAFITSTAVRPLPALIISGQEKLTYYNTVSSLLLPWLQSIFCFGLISIQIAMTSHNMKALSEESVIKVWFDFV